MRKSRFSKDQIIAILKESEGGVETGELCRRHGIAKASKQWLEAKRLAGIPESVVLYCARHRFATDALQAIGNIIAVMDAMGHERVDTLRISSHPELTQIRDAMNKRNGAVQ